MAEGRDDRWWAICLDFDIAVQGESFPEVRDSLHEAIDAYLDRASDLPEDEPAQLLQRRAPWHLRAKFHLLPLLETLRGQGDSNCPR
jgi:predicted RNase H-like HicB family nuclease